jgi:predicted nucleotidyltransferase
MEYENGMPGKKDYTLIDAYQLETLSSQNPFLRTGISPSLLNEIVDAVRRHAKPKKIVLFGSRAMGEWEERSDIDIAVFPEKGSVVLLEPIDEEVRTLLKIDVVDFRNLSGIFQQEVLQNGILLYEAT